MKYLFIDLEFASCFDGVTKICEFGYVLSDESFNVLERNNLIINPNISKYQWDRRVLRKILTRDIGEYESSLGFDYYYPAIRKLITESDCVIGHSLDGDCKGINDECLRYGLDSIDFDFYDIKTLFKLLNNDKNETSVTGILERLEIKGDENVHDGESDAYNTLLALKELCRKHEKTLSEFAEEHPEMKDRNENYEVLSVKRNREEKIKHFLENMNGEDTETISLYSINRKRFDEFCDNLKRKDRKENFLKGKKIYLDFAYVNSHFRQSMKLIQYITDKGGIYSKRIKDAEIFMKYGEEENAVFEGKETIIFEELLKLLKTDEASLDKLPETDFEFLFNDDAVIRDRSEKRIIEMIKKDKEKDIPEPVRENQDNGNTLGDLFKDVFEKLKED